MDHSRRDFIKGSVSLGAFASMGLPAYSLASPGNDFRALICVYLMGGNDAINTILPLSDFHYKQYADVRGALSVAKETIVPTGLNVLDANRRKVPLGLHPQLGTLSSVFERGDANIAVNSGILDQPLTKQSIDSGELPLPDQLFSHNSQTDSWLLGGMEASRNLGWAGRILDVLNSNAQVSPLYSVYGESLWLRAMEHRQTVLKKDRAVKLSALDNLVYKGIYERLLSDSANNPFSEHFHLMINESMTMSQILADQLNQIEDSPLFTSSDLGKQMQTVFKLIASQNDLNQKRQIFFVKHNGYDLHDSQLARHPVLLEDLATNLLAMYQSVDKLGLSKSVTSFTMSDFGRRMTSNGNGTDHGWGGHQLVLGGAVNSNQPIGTWPELVLGGQDDYSRGRLIPTIAADQVSATLAQWMGVSDNSALEYVFPNIRNFADANLGFMS
ncbi:DUF1501 domain-containing protein [Vibrio sp. EA2]|uniref:DUF1501 domain-containing protein n=1 Tax=Vibrio sp. EA2 TaxID=3079860 RepID=UPI002948FA21|nr:DUF1501 domain-containing protein [Vibrio sp. EA2]MDV6250115.1 DUF1501 domain-containing protein [Vibrio sp. EA2]